MRISFLGPIEAPPPGRVAAVERDFVRGTMAELLGELGYGQEQVHFLTVVRAEERLEPGSEVGRGDELTIMLLVGGG